MGRKPTDIVPLQLRLTEALRRKIERAAEVNGRSLNSEMVWRLTQSFAAKPEPNIDDVSELTRKDVEEFVEAYLRQRERKP
jgi:hypothetical protein